MPNLPFDTAPAPSGMNSAADVVSLPDGRCAALQNLIPNRQGILRSSGAWDSVGSDFAAQADGLFWYRSVDPTADRLLVISGGILYIGTIADVYADVPSVTYAIAPNGGVFLSGVPVRGVMFEGELILVQAGRQPLRFDGTAIFQLGISVPDAPSVITAPPVSGTALKTGTISYKQTHFDSRFRESSPSNAATINYTTATYKAGQITASFGSDPQVFGTYIYANTSGGTIYYRIATLYKSAGVTIWRDNVADTTVNTGTRIPNIGQNDPPKPASYVATLKNYVFMNSTASPAELQISNLGSATQWAVANTGSVTDGLKLQITSDQADPITAIIGFGSLLAISKRGTIGFLWGDSADEFIFRPVQVRGTASPDSMVRCDNEFRFLLEDNIYQCDWQGAFALTNVSGEIENVFADARKTAAGRTLLANSRAAFLEQVYYLSIGRTLYAFDFLSGGWYTYLNTQTTANITAMMAVVNAGRAPFLFVAFADGNVRLLKTETDGLVTGMVYHTRALTGGDKIRTRRKRAVRAIVYGTGTIAYGTITFYADRKPIQQYPIVTPVLSNEERLVFQGCVPSVCGNALSARLELTGTKVEIREFSLQFTVLD